MSNPLAGARHVAERLRFAADTGLGRDAHFDGPRDDVRATLFETALRVCKDVTPDLSQRLDQALGVLTVPPDAIDVFVYAAPLLEATCMPSSLSNCVIRVSSALIDILEPAEFQFVLGHEIGHFLLRHGVAAADESDVSGIDR